MLPPSRVTVSDSRQLAGDPEVTPTFSAGGVGTSTYPVIRARDREKRAPRGVTSST